jgi:hypothetical protein
VDDAYSHFPIHSLITDRCRGMHRAARSRQMALREISSNQEAEAVRWPHVIIRWLPLALAASSAPQETINILRCPCCVASCLPPSPPAPLSLSLAATASRGRRLH